VYEQGDLGRYHAATWMLQRECMVIVRKAMLDDTQDIVAVHLTNPDRPFVRPIESLSIAERCDYGGPWMSVESCAIHLNNLLAWGYAPLVVEDEGRVIAEAEFYMGRDTPPFGATLDISVLYVHSDSQRRGAGSLLMEEMIRRGRDSSCEYMTVSGGVGSPAFYGRFGFSPVLDLKILDCDVPPLTSSCDLDLYVPGDFGGPPEGTLWIGRFLSPCQKWREIVDRMKRRDAILSEHAEHPSVVGRHSRSQRFSGFLVPEWGDPAKADVYCWCERLTTQMVCELLAQAHLAGYSQACLLCHPQVAEVVVGVCECSTSRSWPIWGKKL
jgi:GNAT superfamily N-acetyltransferase